MTIFIFGVFFNLCISMSRLLSILIAVIVQLLVERLKSVQIAGTHIQSLIILLENIHHMYK